MADSKLQLIEVLRVRTSLHQHPLHFSWSGTDIDIYSSSYSFPLSVQLSRSVVCDSLWCHVPQYGRLPCPLITARVCSTHVHRVGDAIQPSHPLSSLLLPPSIFPSIRIFSSESVLHIRWPKYRSFSFSISPSNESSGLISFRMDWLDLLAVQGTLKSLLQHHSLKASILWCSGFFFIAQLSHPYMTSGKTIAWSIWTFIGKVMSLLLNKLSRSVMAFLPRSKCLLISWLQSLYIVILEPN